MNRAERRAEAKQKSAPVNWDQKAREYGRLQSQHDCGQLLKDVFTVLTQKFGWDEKQLGELTKALGEPR